MTEPLTQQDFTKNLYIRQSNGEYISIGDAYIKVGSYLFTDIDGNPNSEQEAMITDDQSAELIGTSQMSARVMNVLLSVLDLMSGDAN